MKEDDEMLVKRQFERIISVMVCKAYNKNEGNFENKVIYI